MTRAFDEDALPTDESGSDLEPDPDELLSAIEDFVRAAGADQAKALADRFEPDSEESTRAEFDPAMLQRLLDGGIGPYRIERELGAGGMGIVYLAEQTEPIRRQVALKLIKPGMDSRAVVHRFKAERQALAQLSHPGIAQVFDAGTTDWGHPYFAMEYTPGAPLDHHCDASRMSVDDRLRLFMEVCHAVQHAHQNGIIHRDLKPSNVLVIERDGQVAPKVIDFGLAKATEVNAGGPNTDEGSDRRFAPASRTAGPIGTLEYMSPEQAGFIDAAVDTRTDVYALGVILYRLLTGRHPFDARQRRTSSFEEVRRQLHEANVERPSSRVRNSIDSGAAEAAEARQVSSQQLARRLRGDLDWITLRAMETDPERRYPTVSELATDVLRHLNNDPVVAGPPSIGYQVRKFTLRHRTAVASSIAILTVLIIALGVSLRLYFNAEEARVLAKEHSESAEELHRYLKTILSSPSRNASEFEDQTLLDIVIRESATLDESIGNKPWIEASIRGLFGTVFMSASRPREAADQLRLAVDQWDALGAEFWASSRPRLSDRLERIDAVHSLGRALITIGRSDEATTVLGQYVDRDETFDSLPAANKTKARNTLRLDLAVALRTAGRLSEARRHLRKVLPDDTSTALQDSRHTIAFLELLRVEAEMNDPALADQLSAMKLHLERDHRIPRDEARLRTQYGAVLRTIGRYEDAERQLLAAHRLIEPIFRPNHRLLLSAASELATLYSLWDREGNAKRAAEWRSRSDPQ